MILIFTMFEVFALIVASVLSNKRPLTAILSKIDGGGLGETVGFDKISSLDSLKNVKSRLNIKKLATKSTFTSSVTGTNAIKLIPTPVAAHKLQLVFYRRQAVYRK